MKLWGKREKVGGFIAYYNLTEWWLTNFTEEERKYIDEQYGHEQLGAPKHQLTQGNIEFSSLPVDKFLNSLASWFRSHRINQ